MRACLIFPDRRQSPYRVSPIHVSYLSLLRSVLPEVLALAALPSIGKPLGMMARGPGMHRAELRGGTTMGRQVMKSYLSMAIEMGERFGKG
jgi:hypothetical protein